MSKINNYYNKCSYYQDLTGDCNNQSIICPCKNCKHFNRNSECCNQILRLMVESGKSEDDEWFEDEIEKMLSFVREARLEVC